MARHLSTPPAAPSAHNLRRRWLLAAGMTAALVLVTATVLMLLLGDPLTHLPPAESRGSMSDSSTSSSAPSLGETDAPTDAATSVADGYLPWGVTPFDTQYPGISRMDPALLDVLQRASTQAYADGVSFFVTSGWRSPAQQESLLSQAVSQYGSRERAARWVATADTSLHVQGAAADLDGSGTQDWIARHGPAFGLCLVYDNEPWHVELRPDAGRNGCPPTYADPSSDPRLAR
ncbi:D-alanyl-D-alanine carboxypeptidase family protein [uncultured Microbacterium sp.]|uniref:D-alanyl-D-alanine carboxypeptidase family protein n=1 Tax=uncultured Microbacterium sp. TaxID=191216 RepID=UPI0025DEB052|nr:D-alanyl-D-alanine carboxypeptidase family protein [uncultured Microbacterium sp.]